MFIAAASVPRSFQRTLMPRSAVDQGVVTGVLVSGNYATAAFLQDVIEALAERFGGRAYHEDKSAWRRLTALADLAAIGAGIAIQAALPQQPNEGLPRGALRTSGWYLSTAGLAGLAAAASQEAGSELSRRLRFAPPLAIPAGAALSAIMEYQQRRRLHDDATGDGGQTSHESLAKALGIGGAVAAGLLGVSVVQRGAAAAIATALARIFPGSERQWRPVGRLAALAALGFGVTAAVQNAYHRAESGADKPEPGFEEAPTSPLVSGGPGSVVPYASLTREARRHVLTYLRPEWIEESMGAPARATPIRVYVGLDTAPTDDERVALALAEIDRTGALDRRLVVLVSPTGTGYVNHTAMQAIELLTLGDCATITMQYSKRPSPLSLDRIDEGRLQNRKLWFAIHDRLYGMPPERRPRVVLFGESLGAQTSQDVFVHEGTVGLRMFGIDRALWIGTPYFSKWKEEVLRDDRWNVDRALVGRFNSFEEVEALDPAARSALRFVMVSHDNDAVGYFGADLLVAAPTWLQEPRPPGVPRAQRYAPLLTFVQTLVDMKNSMHFVPGQFVADGHDYRADLGHFINEVYGLGATPEQMLRVEAGLRGYETRFADYIARSKAAEVSA
jgi:uncharacterized membrane protein